MKHIDPSPFSFDSEVEKNNLSIGEFERIEVTFPQALPAPPFVTCWMATEGDVRIGYSAPRNEITTTGFVLYVIKTPTLAADAEGVVVRYKTGLPENMASEELDESTPLSELL